MDSLLAEPSTSQEHATVVAQREKPAYDGWMSSFCDEPSNDAQTCCLGFWLPCVLYGRIDERIKLVVDGKDPEDVGSGCGTQCLIWQVTCGGFAGALTAMRRTRARGLYDISGLLKDDCTKSFFCNMCVLMQTDREIRARNGKTSLQTSASYTRHCSKVIQLQPVATHNMTYAPGEGAEARTEVENMILCRRPPQAQLRDDAKRPSKQTTLDRQHQLREVINASGIDHTIEVVVNCSNKSSASPQAKEGKKGRQIQALPQARLDIAVSQPLLESIGQLPPQITPSSENVDPSRTSRTKSKGLISFFTLPIPSVFTSKKSTKSPDSTTLNTKRASQNVEPRASRGHALVDCSCGSDPSETVGHTLTECITVNHASQRASDTQASEHSLTDCDTIVIAGQRSPVNNHTSYAHDFTECQVDAEILEYFERQEQKSNEHKLAECSVTIATSSQAKKPEPKEQVAESERCSDCEGESQAAEQHKLSNCPSPRKSSSIHVKQHKLVECDRIDSVASAESVMLPASIVAECCLEDSSTTISPLQHPLEHCTRQQSLVNSDTITSGQPASYHQDNGSSRHSEDCDLCGEIKIVKQHRLSHCSRSSSMSALMNPSIQHRLSQCPRSCSMPVLDSKNALGHDMKDCYDDCEQENQELPSHDLEDCLTLPVEESSQAVEVSVEQEQVKASDKGKQRAEGNGKKSLKHRKSKRGKKVNSKSKADNMEAVVDESCNVPNHADLEQQLQAEVKQHAKHTDVVVAVDVVVGGKKLKAEIIPVFDGPASARPSQVVEASAQQALSKVLASSQRSKSVSRRTSQKDLRKHPYQRYPRSHKRPEQENSQDDVVVCGVPGPESVAALAAEQIEMSAGQRLLAAVSGLVSGGSNRE